MLRAGSRPESRRHLRRQYIGLAEGIWPFSFSSLQSVAAGCRYQHFGSKIFSKTVLQGSPEPASRPLCVSYFCAHALVDPILKTIMAGSAYPVAFMVLLRNSRRELYGSFRSFIVSPPFAEFRMFLVFVLPYRAHTRASLPQRALANFKSSVRARFTSLVFSR